MIAGEGLADWAFPPPLRRTMSRRSRKSSPREAC